MSLYNEGQKQIEANQRKSMNVKTQDEINNERRNQQMEAKAIVKEGVAEKEKKWAEAQQESDKRFHDVANQRKFFSKLSEDLSFGRISSKDTLEWEAQTEVTAEEIEGMNDHDFKVWVERNQFASDLRDQRIALEKKKIANVLTDKIIAERDNNWEKKLDTMTKSERDKFDKQYSRELEGLE